MDGEPGFEIGDWGLAKRRGAVIPAKAGIHLALGRMKKWIPAFAGMTAKERS